MNNGYVRERGGSERGEIECVKREKWNKKCVRERGLISE